MTNDIDNAVRFIAAFTAIFCFIQPLWIASLTTWLLLRKRAKKAAEASAAYDMGEAITGTVTDWTEQSITLRLPVRPDLPAVMTFQLTGAETLPQEIGEPVALRILPEQHIIVLQQTCDAAGEAAERFSRRRDRAGRIFGIMTAILLIAAGLCFVLLTRT